MNKTQVVFHVGYHKTGTSWLQKRVFPYLPNCRFVGKLIHPEPDASKGLFGKIRERIQPSTIDIPPYREPSLWLDIHHWSNRIALQPDSQYAPDDVRQAFEATLLNSEINIISQENLSRPYFDELAAQRLFDLAHNVEAKIVVSIRRQRELLVSRYVHDSGLYDWQYKLRDALTTELAPACRHPVCRREGPCTCLALGRKSILLEYYNFYRTYQIYVDAFGADNVLIVPFERLFAQPIEELSRLMDFMGIAISDVALTDFAKAPPVNQSKATHKERLIAYNGADFSAVLDEVEAYYRTSNRQLDNELHLDLSQHGYY